MTRANLVNTMATSGGSSPAAPEVFYARGILGQYVIVIPSKKTVIVRLGKKRADQHIDNAPAEADALIRWGMTFSFWFVVFG